MFKYIAIITLASQVLSMPGMGGMAMNPWMSQWMTPGAAPWAAWIPQPPAAAPGAVAPEAAPAANPSPFAGFAAFGKGGMAIGAMNKQLGMSQAFIGSKCKAAQDEVNAHLDLLKSTAALAPGDQCGVDATATASDIDNQLLTAFDACKMKDDMNQMRLQSLQYKQQMAAYKMAKKACKASLDPATCLTDAAAATGADPNTPTMGQNLADLGTKSDQCIEDTKAGLLAQIDAANDALLLC